MNIREAMAQSSSTNLQQQQLQTLALQGPVLLTSLRGKLSLSAISFLNKAFPELEVRLLVHMETKEDLEDLKKLKVKTFQSPKDYSEALQGVEAVFLIPPPTHRRLKIAVELIAAAKQSGVQFILTLTHLSQEKYPHTPFARVFRDIEEELVNSEIPYCVLQTEIFMDLFLADALNVKKNMAFYYPVDSDAKFNPIAAKDLGEIGARILMAWSEHVGRRYALTGPEPISMATIARVYSEVTGGDVRFVESSHKNAVLSFVGRGFSEWYSKGLVQLLQNLSNGEFDRCEEEGERLLGRTLTGFGEFVDEQKQLYLE